MQDLSSFSSLISTLGFPSFLAIALLYFLSSRVWPYLADQQRQHQAHREAIQSQLHELNNSIQSLEVRIESTLTPHSPYTASPSSFNKRKEEDK